MCRKFVYNLSNTNSFFRLLIIKRASSRQILIDYFSSDILLLYCRTLFPPWKRYERLNIKMFELVFWAFNSSMELSAAEFSEFVALMSVKNIGGTYCSETFIFCLKKSLLAVKLK